MQTSAVSCVIVLQPAVFRLGDHAGSAPFVVRIHSLPEKLITLPDHIKTARTICLIGDAYRAIQIKAEC